MRVSGWFTWGSKNTIAWLFPFVGFIACLIFSVSSCVHIDQAKLPCFLAARHYTTFDMASIQMTNAIESLFSTTVVDMIE